MMRYWTIVYHDHNILGEEYTRWETLSENDILNQYWNYWCDKMYAAGKDPEVMIFENCIEDWCTVHWAQRNYWREMKECIQ